MADLTPLFEQLDACKLAPLDNWKPTKIVDIDIRIAANGEWLYLNSPIRRHRMVKLFSSLLCLEDDQYFLLTPSIKYRINVNDVPFAAVEMERVEEHSKANETQKLYFRTNVDEVVLADHTHPLRLIASEKTGQLVPYITVRSGLKAKITRAVFSQLAELLQPAPKQMNAANTVGVFSAGVFFPFGSVLV